MSVCSCVFSFGICDTATEIRVERVQFWDSLVVIVRVSESADVGVVSVGGRVEIFASTREMPLTITI